MPCCWWSLQTRKNNGSNTGQEALKYCSSSLSLHPPAPPLIPIGAALSVWEKVPDCEGNRNISDGPVPSACDLDNKGSSHRRRFSSQCSQKQVRMGYWLECGHKSTQIAFTGHFFIEFRVKRLESVNFNDMMDVKVTMGLKHWLDCR